MAIKEFQIGPLEYVEGNYFNGDYTQPNVSKSYLQCDIDNFKGGRVITGEFFTDNYIDGTYIHSNTIKSSLSITFDTIVEAVIGLQDYMVESYFAGEYTQPQGSKFSLYARPVFEVPFDIAMTATSSVSSQAVKTVESSTTMSVQFTQTAVGVRGKDIDLFAFSDAAIAALVDRIRDDNIIANTFFTVANDVVRIKQLASEVDFSAAIAALNERNRDTSIETQVAFSFGIQDTLFKDFSASISSSFSQTAQQDKIIQGTASVSSNLSQAVAADRFRDNQITTSASFAVSADFRVVRDAHLTGTGIAAMSIDAIKTASALSAFTSTTSQSFLGGKVKTYQAALPVYASVFVSRKIADLRPRNLPIVTNQFSYYDSTRKKFGTHGFRVASGLTNFDRKLGGNGPNNFNLTAGDSFALEGWIYFDNTTSAAITVRVNGIQIYLGANSLRFQGGILGSDGNFAVYSPESSISFNRNVWNYFAIVSDGSRASWYVNTNRWYSTTTLPASYWNGGVLFSTVTDGVWIDELSYHQGTTLGYNPSNTTITLPTSARTNSNPTTQALWHFDGNGFDDYTASPITQTADSAITAVSTTATSATKLVSAVSSVSATASITATIGSIEQNDCQLFNTAAVACSADRTRDNNAGIDAQTSVSVSADRSRDNQSTISANFATSVPGERTRYQGSDLASTISTSTVAVKTTDTSSNQSSSFVQTAVIGKLEEIVLTAFTNGALVTVIDKTTAYASAIQSTATVNSIVGVIKPMASALSDSIGITASAQRTRDTGSAFTSSATISASAEILKIASASLSAVHKTKQTYIEEEGTYYVDDGYFLSYEIIVQKTVSATVTASIQTALTANIGGSFFAQLVANSSANVSATAVKQTDVIVTKAAVFTVVADVRRTRDTGSNLSSAFTVFANGVTSAEVDIVAFTDAALSLTPTITRSISENFSSAFTQFTETVDSLNISGNAAIQSVSTLAITPIFVANAQIQTNSIASSLTVAVKDVVSDVLCEFAFAVNVSVDKFTNIAVSGNAVSTLSAVANKTTDNIISASASLSSTASAKKVVNPVITTTSIASQLSVIAKTGGFFINSQCQFSVAVDAVVVRRAQSNQSATITAVITPNQVYNISSSITTQSSLAAVVGVRKQFGISIASAMTFVAEVREVRLDEIEYKIPAEGWIYTIVGEDREYDIVGETRLRSITGETRVRNIDGETRIYIVE